MNKENHINTIPKKGIPKRGQIYFIKQPNGSIPVGSEMWADRYGLIVSNDVNNKYSNTVQVAYLTTSQNKQSTVKPLPTHVDIKCSGKTAVACCEQIHTIDKSRIGDYIDEITDMTDINKAIVIQFAVPTTSHPVSLFKKWEACITKYDLTELFHINDNSVNTAIIESLMKERDEYRALYELKAKQLENLKTMVSCCV